ncbi:hypothetical protein LguiA_035755 [Lonicera macranthoides]
MGSCCSTLPSDNKTPKQEEEEDDDDIPWWTRNKGKNTKLNNNNSDDLLFIGRFGAGAPLSVDELALLHRTPGRLFVNGATNISSLYTQQGKKGTNQDAMIVWENFSSRSDTVFCGVFDGHGPYGHMVARKVRDSLPVLLYTLWEGSTQSCASENPNANGSTTLNEELLDGNWCEQLEVEEGKNHPEIYLLLKQSLLNAFKLMDKELKLHPTIDCFCSGTTAVTLIKQGLDLIIANVGDSRAVLATKDKDKSLIAVQLTVDLKPNLPREAARIQQCQGRVFALQDEPEVARVWLPNSNSPGLAMARAFGDFCLKNFGLISIPDVYYHRVIERDEFIVLATDGVWDVLSNKEAVDVVAKAPSRATAARALVDCATRAWRLKYPTSKNDDCAAVCLFLEHASPPNVVRSDNMDKALEERVTNVESRTSNIVYNSASQADNARVVDHSGTLKALCEIEPVTESTEKKRRERSLAECISIAEDEEWSALEGVTRVNSLLSIPRFL